MITTVVASLAVLLLVAAVVVVVVRRSWLVRAGAIDVCWRTDLRQVGSSWILGKGRFEGDALALYRVFSPLPGAARLLRRERLELGDRRSLAATEPDLLPVGSVVVRCTADAQPIELALSEPALTGLRSWVESMPPGSPAHRPGGVRDEGAG